MRKTLKIKEVSKEDTGTYECKGTNGFGSEVIKIDLIVIGMGLLVCGVFCLSSKIF